MKKVLASGVFDLLHSGHIRYLEYAKGLGDYLIVHVESDEAVRRHKGEERPVNNQKERLNIINALKIVDEDFVADGEKEAELILKKYQPDFFVLAPKKHLNQKEMEDKLHQVLRGLKIVWFNKEDTLSSSKIIKKIKSL